MKLTWHFERLTNKLTKHLKHIACSLFMVSVLMACANKPIPADSVMLTPTLNYHLQPVPEALINKGIQALLNISREGNNEKLLIQVEMTADNILVSGMTIEGFTLFTINWKVNQKSVVIDKVIAIDPLRILAELQLSLWPIQAVNQGLSSAIATSSNSVLHNEIESIERKIEQNTTVLYLIKQQGEMTTLQNKQNNYMLVIKELDRWELATVPDNAVTLNQATSNTDVKAKAQEKP